MASWAAKGNVQLSAPVIKSCPSLTNQTRKPASTLLASFKPKSPFCNRIEFGPEAAPDFRRMQETNSRLSDVRVS